MSLLKLKFTVDASQPHIDIAEPLLPVQVQVSDGVLWVNVDGVCVLRVCKCDVEIEETRKIIR